MSVTVYSEEPEFMLDVEREATAYNEQPEFMVYSMIGAVQQSVVNRVWDTVAVDFVRWATAEIDGQGLSYPGPGTFGVDTTDYVVETIEFTRV